MIEASMQLIPYVGSSLATLYFGNKQEQRFQRLEKFYKEISEDIKRMPNTFKEIDLHEKNELLSIIEDLNEKIEIEHIKLKIEIYKKYFINTLIFPVNGNYNERKYFLDVLSSLSIVQIRILLFLNNKQEPIDNNYIVFDDVDETIIQGSIMLLKNFGLIDYKIHTIVLDDLNGSVTESITLSQFGKKFNNFCLNEIHI